MITYTNDPSRYLKIMDWAARRYTKHAVLPTHDRGYRPSVYLRIEDAAFRKYIVPKAH